jgi:hypothetical protein
MSEYAQSTEKKPATSANSVSQQAQRKHASVSAEQLSLEASPLMQRQKQQSEAINDSPVTQAKALVTTQREAAPVQRNNTGLPDNLKSGMENLSGMSLDHVKVHYNSAKPAAVQAHAYAQGSDIHLGSGQEKHLPHELGHVVQQAQGRVKPTTSIGGMAVNDNAGLESEADVMGAKALRHV